MMVLAVFADLVLGALEPCRIDIYAHDTSYLQWIYTIEAVSTGATDHGDACGLKFL